VAGDGHRPSRSVGERIQNGCVRPQLGDLDDILERWPGSPRNPALLIDRHGQDVLCYAKVHTCDWGMESALTPGEFFEVARLDIEGGYVDLGVMICADREFPESARELMLGGAELILVPNACPMAGERTYQLRSRAFENMTGSFSRQAMPRTSTLPLSIWTHSGSTEGGRRWETHTGNPVHTGA